MKNQIEHPIFQMNVELWSQEDPKKALMLPYHDCSDIEFCSTKQNEKNLFKIQNGEKKYYHSQEGALDEAKQWALDKTKQLDDTPIIFIYGVGLGYYYEALKPWLDEKSDRFLVFLEDDLSVICRLFQTEQGSEILSDPKVKLLYFENLDDEEATLEVLYWNYAMSNMAIFPLKLYLEIKNQSFSDLKYKLIYDAEKKNALVEEYLKYGSGFFKNFYPNMLRLAQSSWGNALFGKFKNIPAIICGAGPSLEKQLPLLKKLSSQAIIFAGGSSLKALNAADILPHFAAAIDPNASQTDRLETQASKEVPFFYRSRLHYEAFKLIQAPKLYISGVGGYDVADYFEEFFDIQAEFLDEGHNVINFALQIAEKLGCNPIIFIGLDLAYTDCKLYSPGVVTHAQIETDDQERLKRKDIYDHPVATEWKWIAEADWIGQFAKDHPELTILNSTEGGIGLPNIPNISFVDVIKNHLIKKFDIKDRIDNEIRDSKFKKVTSEKILEEMENLKQSLLRCMEGFQTIYDDSMKVIQTIKQEKKIPSTIQGGMAALAEIEIEDEPAYKYVLDIFNAVYSRLLNNEIHQLKMESTKLTEEEKIVKRLEINSKRIKFLNDVADVNVQLINLAIENDRGLL